VAIPKVNTKSLIKSKLPASTTNTLSIPKPTVELSNVETLNSKNLVGEGNTPLPELIKDQKIAEGVEKNTPGMAACIKEKIKDLAGVFTVPLGIPSFDQFKVPDINDAPNLSVKDAFKATFDDIKNTVKGTVNGIKEAFTFKKQQGLDQIETGGLSLKKFLGCEEMDVDFTPRERKEAVEKPEIITKKEEEGVKKSQAALAAQADENVKQRTEPPAEKSKQEEVQALTNPEDEIKPLTWSYYSIRVYKTPNSEDLEIGTMNALVEAGVSIIDSFEKIIDSEQFIISVIDDVINQNYKYVYDIVSEKDQNPDIANYDVNERKKKEAAIKKLPAGYFIITFVANNESYELSDFTSLPTSYTRFEMMGKYMIPGEKVERGKYESFTEYRLEGNTYIEADQKAVNRVMKGENLNYFAEEIRAGKVKVRLNFK